jgi:hypothetical protein
MNRHLCSPHTLECALQLKQFGLAGLLMPRVAREFERFAKQENTLSDLYLRMRKNGRTLPIASLNAQAEAVDFVSTEMLLASAPDKWFKTSEPPSMPRGNPEVVLQAVSDERLLEQGAHPSQQQKRKQGPPGLLTRPYRG